MLTVLIVVAVMELLIATHVLAFAVVGTLAGVRPEEIQIGWGPGPSFSAGMTRWRLGLIPLGGSTRFPTRSGDEFNAKPPAGWSRPRQLEDLSPWRRLLITLTGPAALFALAVGLFAIASIGSGPTVDVATVESPVEVYILNAPIATMIERPEAVGIGEHFAILVRLASRWWQPPDSLQPRAEWAGQTGVSSVSLMSFLAERLRSDPVSGAAGVGYGAVLLAVFNLLPTPPLNGGVALMQLYECLFGRPVPDSVLTPLTLIGTLLWVGLMVVGFQLLF